MRVREVLIVPTLTTGFTMSLGERGQDPNKAAHERVGEAVSLGLVLENGRTVWGDGMGVAHGGASGRDAVLHWESGLPAAQRYLRPALVGRDVTGFQELAAQVEGLRDEQGRPLNMALRYGATQAILGAAAESAGTTMAEVICAEYGTTMATAPIPLLAQSGLDWRGGAEKMMQRRLAVFPHASIYDPNTLAGDGEALLEFVRWVKDRAAEIGDPSYRPTIHFDVYGTFGAYFQNDLGKIADLIARLGETASPLGLQVECMVNLSSRQEQIEAFATVRRRLQASGSPARIIVDEWANTLEDIKAFVEAQAADIVQIKMPDLGGLNNAVEAVLLCKEHGIGAYLGGSCLETDLSSRISTHVALATQPLQMLAKPGLGVDEPITIMTNEMLKTLAVVSARAGQPK